MPTVLTRLHTYQTTGTTYTFTNALVTHADLTVANDGKVVIAVKTYEYWGTPSVSSVVIDPSGANVTLTLIRSETQTDWIGFGDMLSGLWYTDNVGGLSGSLDVVVTMAAQQGFCAVDVIQMKTAASGAPEADAGAGDSSGSSHLSYNITTLTNNALVISSVTNDNESTALTKDVDLTEYNDASASIGRVGYADDLDVTAGTIDCGWSNGDSYTAWVGSSCSIAPAAAASAVPNALMMMGVGT